MVQNIFAKFCTYLSGDGMAKSPRFRISEAVVGGVSDDVVAASPATDCPATEAENAFGELLPV